MIIVGDHFMQNLYNAVSHFVRSSTLRPTFMKTSHLVKIVSIPFLALFTTMTHAQSTIDTAAINNILQEEVVAWNKGDAEAYSKHFAEDGTFTNILGMFFRGHNEFLTRHEQIFKGTFNKTLLQQTVVSLRFFHADLAVVETLTWISGFSKAGPPQGTHVDPKGRLRTRLLQVIVRIASDWKIVVYHNVDLKPGTTAPEPQ
jgi:uncharacterized protein (TIGR02246 family)